MANLAAGTRAHLRDHCHHTESSLANFLHIVAYEAFSCSTVDVRSAVYSANVSVEHTTMAVYRVYAGIPTSEDVDVAASVRSMRRVLVHLAAPPLHQDGADLQFMAAIAPTMSHACGEG
jgi:hypothetical protein